MSKLPSDLSTVTTVAVDLAKHIFQVHVFDDICVIPEIALYYDGSGQQLLCAFVALCETKWMHR